MKGAGNRVEFDWMIDDALIPLTLSRRERFGYV